MQPGTAGSKPRQLLLSLGQYRRLMIPLGAICFHKDSTGEPCGEGWVIESKIIKQLRLKHFQTKWHPSTQPTVLSASRKSCKEFLRNTSKSLNVLGNFSKIRKMTHMSQFFLICWVRSHHDSSLVRSGRSTADTDRPSVGWADAQKLDADFELQLFVFSVACHSILNSPPNGIFFWQTVSTEKKRDLIIYTGIYIYIYIHITKSWRSSWNHHVRLTKDHLTGPFDWRAGQVRRPANQVCVFLRDHRSTFLVEGLDCKPLIQI